MDKLINSFLIESDKDGKVRIQSYGIDERDVLQLLLKRERLRQRAANTSKKGRDTVKPETYWTDELYPTI